MELEGQIETIIYCNEINSYTVAKLITENIRRNNNSRISSVCKCWR
ncbi:MAG: hypothetical protein HFJ54_05280 [Clostridia bacterium]|nr:hypothetical protein [Clostridia bacterium]